MNHYEVHPHQKLRGTIFIVLGILLLLYILGFIQMLGSSALIILSLFLIVSGFIESGLYKRIVHKTDHIQH
jgi:uncharacterized membrane protein